MVKQPTTRHIFLLILAVLLLSTLACRATGRVSQRLNQNEATGSNELDFSEPDGTGETAVPAPDSSSDAAELGDEFENLLQGLINENDQADNLEDFPDFGN